VLRGNGQRFAGIRPLEGMGKVGIPRLNEAMNEVAQVLSGADTGATQTLATQDREPDLDLVEPRAMGGQPVESDLGALGGAPVQHGLLLMKAGVVYNQMPATVGVAGAQGAQEVAKLQIGMALIALGEDLPRADLKGGKESDSAVADILKLLAFDPARAQGQCRMPPLQGLDPSLLIETEDPTVTRRMQIEIENLRHLLFKQRVGAGQEVAHPMGFEHQGRQNPLHGGRTHRQNLSPACHHPGQIADAVVRKAAKLPFLNALTGDGHDGVPGQRGKNPVGDPTGGERGERLRGPADRLPPPPLAAPAHTGQTACATSAPNCATCQLGRQSLGWTALLAPTARCSRGGPSVGAFSQLVAALPRPGVPLYLSEFHTGASAYAPRLGQRSPQYTANELARHGTSATDRI